MPDDLAPRGFYEGLTARSLMARWARREQQHTGSQSEMHVHVWRAAEAQTALQEASRFVGTDVAERRNLIMVNPAPGNTYATTRNLVAAYQMIQPGETARSHRHTPAALRLVLDAANDVYTVVDGKRVDMTPGDVVLTPSWHWHGHANEGGETAFWLDFLDVPFVRHVEAMFFEHHPNAFQRPTQRDSTYRIPLATVLADQTGMYSVEIAKDVMPTIGLHAIRLSSGAVTERLHQTANNLYAVASGTVRATTDGRVDEVLARGDVIAIPPWHGHVLHGVEDATLLRISRADHGQVRIASPRFNNHPTDAARCRTGQGKLLIGRIANAQSLHLCGVGSDRSCTVRDLPAARSGQHCRVRWPLCGARRRSEGLGG